MPDLDVSFVVTDPMLADTFSVTRRQQVLVNGEMSTTDTVIPNVIGVVTQESPYMLMTNPDAGIVPRRIFVASQFDFRGLSQQADGAIYQPDLITWNGTTYKVLGVLPYQRYGEGITEVVAESVTALDVPQ